MRIGIWMENTWAFGRFKDAYVKYGDPSLGITHIDWKVPCTEAVILSFDMFYIPSYPLYQMVKSVLPVNSPALARIMIGLHCVEEILDHASIATREWRVHPSVVEELKRHRVIHSVSYEISELLSQEGIPTMISTGAADTEAMYPNPETSPSLPVRILAFAFPNRKIGKRYHLYAQLAQQFSAQNPDLIPHVSWTLHETRIDNVPELRALYAAHDVFICLSYDEGGPLPPMEAAACGLAIVTTDCGVMPRMFRDEENGMLLPARAHESVVLDAACAKVAKLVRDRDMLKRLKQQALATVEAEWNFKRKAQEFGEICKSFILSLQSETQLHMSSIS